MAQIMVELDDTNQRMVRVLDKPPEAQETTFVVVEGPVDLDAQTIQGVPIAQIYKNNEGKFIHSFIVKDGVHHVSKE